MSTVELTIDMDSKCSECGALGACNNGRCLSCNSKRINGYHMSTRQNTEAAEAIRQKVIDMVDSLLTKNMNEIEAVRKRLLLLEEPEGMSLSFSVKMTCDVFPTIEVGIKYSETYKDSICSDVTNPAQRKLAI